MSITLIKQVIWKEYNEINAKKLTKIIDDLENIEICYSENPTNPSLQYTRIIHQISQVPNSRSDSLKKKLAINNKIWFLLVEDWISFCYFLDSYIDLIQCLSIVCVPLDLSNVEYENLSSKNDILASAWKYSCSSQGKAIVDFDKWCSNYSIHF